MTIERVVLTLFCCLRSISVAPASGSIATVGTTTFADTVSPAAGIVGPVTFTTTRAAHGLTLTGNTIATTRTLAVGGYTISATDTDDFGDPGIWSYTLTVTKITINQNGSTSGTVTAGAPTSAQLSTTGGNGTVSCTTTSGTAITVSASGAVTVPATIGANFKAVEFGNCFSDNRHVGRFLL